MQLQYLLARVRSKRKALWHTAWPYFNIDCANVTKCYMQYIHSTTYARLLFPKRFQCALCRRWFDCSYTCIVQYMYYTERKSLYVSSFLKKKNPYTIYRQKRIGEIIDEIKNIKSPYSLVCVCRMGRGKRIKMTTEKNE